MKNDISHDLRTPLHVIMGHASLLLEKIDSIAQNGERKELEVIYDHSQLLSKLVSDVFELYEQGRAIGEMEERERIAREVHDGLAQHLGLLYTRVTTLEMRPNVGAIREELDSIKNLAGKAYEEARAAISGFKSGAPGGCGLASLVNAYLHEFSERTNIATELNVDDPQSMQLSPQGKTQVIKIIQQSLANVREHANAKRVSMVFDTEEDQAKISIQDDGWGFQLDQAMHPKSGRFGLEIMRERAELAGGMFKVESQPGKGTMLTIRLPLELHKRDTRK